MDGFRERRNSGFKRRNFDRGRADMPKPVAVGDVLEVTIDSTGKQGDGITKKDGFVIFVKGASQGQTVKIKIIALGRSSATAEVVSEKGATVVQEAPSSEKVESTEDTEDLQ